MRSNGDVFLQGKRLRLDPRQALGTGGKADVYDIGHGTALKLFKTPEHLDLQNDAAAREVARQRLEEHQRKLPLFPRDLPPQVVTPTALATAAARGGPIRGYAMPLLREAEVLLRYSDRAYRESSGIGPQSVVPLFQALREAVLLVHRAGVVIGDFNDLNVLVKQGKDHTPGTCAASTRNPGAPHVYLIDADSFQFGAFPCRVFTTRFVDPLLCDPHAPALVLHKPCSPASDWYAFCVMLMQCLLFVDPYGGLYRPRNPAQRVAHHLRPLHRLTIFHSEVRYPKPAVPYDRLPDELLHFFHRVFEQDHREPFPAHLLASLRWTTCTICGGAHARPRCPHCQQPAPAAIRQTTVVRGRVTATRLFRTSGHILEAAFQDGRVLYLYHESGQYKREDGFVVARGDLKAGQRFRLQREATLIAGDGYVRIVSPSNPAHEEQRTLDHSRADFQAGLREHIAVETAHGQPVFDANERSLFSVSAGQLWRMEASGLQTCGTSSMKALIGGLERGYIGDVLTGQTRLWVGTRFGFGFYRAGALGVAFVFGAEKGGLNDSVKLPPLPGQIIDAACSFAAERCWFFLAVQESGRIFHRCFVVRRDAAVEASGTAEKGDSSWLGGPLHGHCAADNYLLAATDEGVVRVEADPTSSQGATGGLTVTKSFPDTEPFVNQNSRLLPGPGGLCVVNPQEIQVLAMR